MKRLQIDERYFTAALVSAWISLCGATGCAVVGGTAARADRSSIDGSDCDPELVDLGRRIRARYRDADYIEFDAEIVQHESLKPGFVVAPGAGTRDGTVFHAVMSRYGDARADLRIGDELVYSFQVSANCRAAGSRENESRTYTLREYNHRDHLASSPVTSSEVPTDLSLTATVLDGPTGCSCGTVLRSHIGPLGRFVTSLEPNDYSESERVSRGTLVRRSNIDGVESAVVAYEQRAADCTLGSESPGISWHYAVDEQSGLMLNKEAFIVPCEGDPYRIRFVRYRNVRFPKVLDVVTLFERPPSGTEGFVTWIDSTPTQANGATADVPQ